MKKGKTFIVYEATNTLDGKRYVGCTGQGLAKRRRAHLSRAIDPPNGYRQRVQKSILKDGADAFIWRVLAEFSSEDEALQMEEQVIASTSPEYNVARGGHSGSKGLPAHNRIGVICLETGALFVSIEAAAVFYGVDKGCVTNGVRGGGVHIDNYHFIKYTQPLSEEQRSDLIRKIDRRSAIMRRRKVELSPSSIGSQETPGRDTLGRSTAGPMTNARPVICLDDGARCLSASAASRDKRVPKSAIIELCLGKNGRVSAGGFRFQYIKAN